MEKTATDSYRQSTEDVLANQKVDQSKGLSAGDVTQRLETFGRNVLEAKKRISPIKIFLGQFKDILIVVLILAATVSLGISIVEDHGSFTEPILIYGIVVAIAVIGFLNEYKAERTVEALKKLVGHKAKVRRGGETIEVEASEIVPGDIVLIEEGQRIPADIRLLMVNNIGVDEATLTGESVPVSKNTFAIDKTVAVGDQKNMVFSGTLITTGTGEGVVTATAHNTQLGKIASMVNVVEEGQTPMQKKLDDLGRKLGAIILVVCIMVFITIFFLDRDLYEETMLHRLMLAFTAAVALAVAAIPEGLAFVVRISLALGARRMAAQNALVRKLSAVEALGSTDVVCSDKTGTLTRGEMTVRKILFDEQIYEVGGSGYETKGEFTLKGKAISDPKVLEPLLRIGLLCNNAHIKEQKVLGDPTEGSLIVSAAKVGLDRTTVESEYPRVAEIPFSSERKVMSTIHGSGRKFLLMSKGAPDILLNKCDRLLVNGKVRAMTAQDRSNIAKQNSAMSQEALRVLAFAYKESQVQPKGVATSEDNLIFAGLQGMMDPPRIEVKEVMHSVQAEAGMRVIMITGDYIDTARAVAKEIGIEGEAISGTELDKLTPEEFKQHVEKISVYARVNPEHKIRIVQALQAHGHQVAMTGDGVNDAPAIKAADIGIAMGITGSDASKEAADLILLDDQFLTIIKAIEEGRGIFDNVRKFVDYLLSANIAEVLTVFGGIVMFGHLVLSAAQLLFINIVTDGLPAIALGSDPAEKGIMRFKPRRFQQAIVNRRIWFEMFIFGMLMTIVLLSQYWYLANYLDEATRATTAAFAAMVIYEMVRLIGIRSNYQIKWFSNPWLSVAIAGSVALLLSVIYIEPAAKVFSLGALHAVDWLVIAAGSIFLLVIMKGVDYYLDHHMNEPAHGLEPPKVKVAA